LAEIRWERNAVGVVLDLSERSRRRVVSEVARLSHFPELGMPAMGVFSGRRRLLVGPYSVVYEYDAAADVVSVIAIARGGPTFR